MGVESSGSASCASLAFLLGDLRVEPVSAFSLPFCFAGVLEAVLALDLGGGRRTSSSSESESSIISLGSIGRSIFVVVLPRERIFARSAMSKEYGIMSSSAPLVSFCLPLLAAEGFALDSTMGSAGVDIAGVGTLVMLDVDGRAEDVAMLSVGGAILYAGLGFGFGRGFEVPAAAADGVCTVERVPAAAAVENVPIFDVPVAGIFLA